jgi:hypothetical protein
VLLSSMYRRSRYWRRADATRKRLAGIAALSESGKCTISAIVAPRFFLLHQVVVGGVVASRLAGVFQIVDVGQVELEISNFGAQCWCDERCRVGNPQFRRGRVGMGLERNPFELLGVTDTACRTFTSSAAVATCPMRSSFKIFTLHCLVGVPMPSATTRPGDSALCSRHSFVNAPRVAATEPSP